MATTTTNGETTRVRVRTRVPPSGLREVKRLARALWGEQADATVSDVGTSGRWQAEAWSEGYGPRTMLVVIGESKGQATATLCEVLARLQRPL
jgi:hypothetical protein